MNTHLSDCTTCAPRIIIVNEQLDRRSFLKKTTAAALALAAAPVARAAKSETLVQQLHKSLTEEQRKAVCFAFNDPKRSLVDNNWQIVPQTVSGFFTADQQALIRDIFTGLHSPEYAETVMKQVASDSGKAGFGASSVALFGEPESGKFEFVLTGRHCTRRCDGDSVEGAAGEGSFSLSPGLRRPCYARPFRNMPGRSVVLSSDGCERRLLTARHTLPLFVGTRITVDHGLSWIWSSSPTAGVPRPASCSSIHTSAPARHAGSIHEVMRLEAG